MKMLPETENSIVLRTDFSDDGAWAWLCDKIREPSVPDGFRAYVDCISDRAYEALDAPAVTRLARMGKDRSFLFVADSVALSDPGHPVLVVDLRCEPGRTFRAFPSEVWGIENNLSIGNMDFHEFADNVDPDGVFRGFRDSN